jgi:antitoxin (DNA-binding transcriptional repressor) of toxin-antitoxin stability system
MLAGKEDIIITRNGTEIAKLSALSDSISECSKAPGAPNNWT